MVKINEILNDQKAIEKIARGVFLRADADHNGYISMDELDVLIKYISAECQGPSPTSKDIEEIMKSMDTNNDGKLTFEEFLPLVSDILKLLASKGL